MNKTLIDNIAIRIVAFLTAIGTVTLVILPWGAIFPSDPGDILAALFIAFVLVSKTVLIFIAILAVFGVVAPPDTYDERESDETQI